MGPQYQAGIPAELGSHVSEVSVIVASQVSIPRYASNSGEARKELSTASKLFQSEFQPDHLEKESGDFAMAGIIGVKAIQVEDQTALEPVEQTDSPPAHRSLWLPVRWHG
jgi:hypothetical protein